MEVILLEDVKTLGKKGQIVKINDGYARNFVLPKKLGIEATPKNLNDLKLQKKREEKEAAEELAENGAFYITSREDLLRTKNRVSGNIKAVEMCEDSFFEIDEPSDWIIIEALMKKNGITANADETEVLKNVKLFLTDCDGCLTDGGMYYSEHGDELKKFNTRDGMGFGLLKKAGIKTGIVTSENVQLVQNRANKLKLDFLKMGAGDKLTVIKRICDEMHISLEETAYIGDDINDVAVIENVGFGCSVNNGMTQAKSAARYVTNANGGEGAIREVAELILAARS